MSRHLTLISWLALITLAACDRQVDAEFQGDSLMRIRGSVAIPLGLEGSDLVPALAFDVYKPVPGEDACSRSDQTRFVEVGVTGDFPSNFTLDVFDPPPPEAMSQAKDGPAFAQGTVAALPRLHPDALRSLPADNETFEDWNQISLDTCYIEDGPGSVLNKPGPPCLVVHACTLDGERCLHRELSCEPSRSYIDLNDCELVDSNGDEALGVAGYSVNYSVVYFDGPVEAGTSLADLFAGGEPIEAGYHLYRIRLPDQQPPECLFLAFEEAAERYNEEHGTAWEPHQFRSTLPIDDDRLTFEEHRAYSCEVSRVLAETECKPVQRSFEEVEPDGISIELGALNSTSFM